MSIYNYEVKTNNGELVSLSKYKGKVLLIVNTASKCGFTSQYEGLEAIYKKFSPNFTVLAFPCNQFGAQEPGSDQEIREFCDLNYKVTFPLFSKVEVNGKDTHPLYDYLKSSAPGVMGSEKIKWNFTKFLIDSKGNVTQRFAPATKPESIEKEIKELL